MSIHIDLPRRAAPFAFVALTFALSWPVWIIAWVLCGRPPNIGTCGQMTFAIYAGSFAPGVAAAVLSRLSGKDVLVAWFRSFFRLRCGWRAYAAALLPIPLALLLLTILLGYTPRADKAHGLPAVAFYVTLFPISLFNGLLTAAIGAGPLGEEGGWRGYLLPRLVERGPLRAALIVGIIWAIWHLPIMVLFADWRSDIALPLYLPMYTLGVVGLSIVMTSVWRIGRGSLVPCIWLHGVINSVGAMAFDHRIWSSHWSAPTTVLHFDLAIWLAAGTLLFLARGRRNTNQDRTN